MERKDVKALLRACSGAIPEDRVLSDKERRELRGGLTQMYDATGPAHKSVASSPRRLRVFVIGLAAAAAMIALAVNLYDRPLEDLEVRVVVAPANTSRGLNDERFEVHVSVGAPAFVYLVVLDERDGLTILRMGDTGGSLVDERGTLGSYSLWLDDSKGQRVRRTHAILLACEVPVSLDSLAQSVPDRLPLPGAATRQESLPELRGSLQDKTGCAVRIREFPPSGDHSG